jgi:hypothetical protein
MYNKNMPIVLAEIYKKKYSLQPRHGFVILSTFSQNYLVMYVFINKKVIVFIKCYKHFHKMI